MLVGFQIAEFPWAEKVADGVYSRFPSIRLCRLGFLLSPLVHHLARHLAAHIADLAFQITHAGFPRVVLDQRLQAGVGEIDLLCSTPVSFVCLGTRKRLAISSFSSSV